MWSHRHRGNVNTRWQGTRKIYLKHIEAWVKSRHFVGVCRIDNFVDFSLSSFCGIHLRAIPQLVPKVLFSAMSCKSILYTCISLVLFHCRPTTGGRLKIKMSYQYRDPHVKDKTVSRPSYLYHGNPHTRKHGLCIETGPGPDFTIRPLYHRLVFYTFVPSGTSIF